MKRTFLFLLLVLLTWEVRADYTPFVVEGKTWVIEFDYDWEMNTDFSKSSWKHSVAD